jgi:hypothetical protein
LADRANVIYVEFSREVDHMNRPISYIATSQDFGITTTALTFEKMLENLKDAIRLSIQNLDPTEAYGISEHPRIIVQMEIDYAEIAATDGE